jgi:uncharacterized protein YndB with AHSA1/START domain
MNDRTRLRSIPRPRIGFAFALFVWPFAAIAEVASVGTGGFVIAREHTLAAPPAEAYRRFVDDYGRWWNSAHSWSGDANNFSLDARPGGCLCERWAEGAAMHMMVGYVEPGRVLRLVGGLGPLQQLGLSGTLNLNFEPAGANATRMKVEYRVVGFDPAGFAQLAPVVDGVLAEQFGRLERYVATGSAEAPAAR